MSAPLLELRGLGRRFGGLQAVSDLDLFVRAGEILGVIGPNGAGKSTTFNMIAGSLTPSAGEIWMDGQRMAQMAPHTFAARGILRTFQHNKPFESMSLCEKRALLGRRPLAMHSPKAEVKGPQSKALDWRGRSAGCRTIL